MLAREKALEALEVLNKRIPLRPQVAIVLGSGLGDFAQKLDIASAVSYEEIPYWPRSTAPGHEGRLLSGTLLGIHVVVMQGRVHFYEGYSMEEVAFPVRVFGEWGVRVYIATNASGGINLSFSPGDLVLISDHINFMGSNPLVGENEPKWGERFPDMTHAYDPELMEIAEKVAQSNQIPLKKGVYIAFSGPSFETPAEIRMARALGADMVGMSTVPEVIVANHMKMRVCGISCVANYAAGITDKPLSHQEVLDEMAKSSGKLAELVLGLLSGMGEKHV